MNQHHVVIAGGGLTGLMLAGELALAGIDVADRRTAARPGDGRLAGGWPPFAHHRDFRPALALRRGFSPRDKARPRPPASPAFCSISATSPPVTPTGSAMAGLHRASLPAGSRNCRLRSIAASRSPGWRRTRRASTSPAATGRSCGRNIWSKPRWRAEPSPQGGGHRVPGSGPTTSNSTRRGRDDRNAGAGHPQQRAWPAFLRPAGVPDRRRQDRLRRSRSGAGHGHRAASGGEYRPHRRPARDPAKACGTDRWPTTCAGSRASPMRRGRRRPNA